MIKDLLLKKHFADFREAWQIENIQEALAFEKFVNYIILSQDDLSAFIGHPELLDFCCTGGGDDAKLDGIGIKLNGQLVGSIEDIDQIVNASKKIDVEFFLIQSKERTDFDSSAVNTFGIGVKHFFSEPLLPENEKVKSLRELKDYIFNDEKVFRKLTSNPSVNVYYVFCGTTPVDEHTEAIKKILLEGLQSCSDCLGDTSMEIIDCKKLIEKCKDLENDFRAELNIRDILPLTVSDNNLIKKAYTFTCEAKELLKLMTKDDGTLRRSLFNSNVRDYLGNKGSVNSEIEKTISEDPEMFLMCNNGITIVCSNFIQVKDKLVSIENPQIVNGCQTSTTIFMQRSNDSLSKVQVLVKLICTEDNTITNKIVRGTNKQNQVLEESFETTKPFHQDIEDYFVAKGGKIKLYYERRNKQYSSITTINRFQIVNLRVITQSFVATFLQKPYLAHRHESKLLQEFAPNETQREIFNSTHSPYPYYISALIWYVFEDAFRKKILHKRLRTYIAHLFFILMFQTGKYPLKANADNKALEKYCEALEKLLLSDKIENTLIQNAEVFEKCKNAWVAAGKNRYVMKDTKEFTEELTKFAREVFINKSICIETTSKPDIESWHLGRILSFRNNTKWFAFIKTDNSDNVYFDQRSFSGNVRELIPGRSVTTQHPLSNIRRSENDAESCHVEITPFLPN